MEYSALSAAAGKTASIEELRETIFSGKSSGNHYFYNEANGAELILCEGVFYPLHNHSSVLIIGIVMAGCVRLRLKNTVRQLTRGSRFIIPPYMPHEADVRAGRLLSLCIDRRADGQAGQTPFPEVTRLLEQCPEQRLPVAELAGLAGYSEYHFIRKFRREVGLTPHQFQLQNRIRRAQRLLPSAASAAEAALAAGFCDQSHFNRQFLRAVGLTPHEYLRRFHVFTEKRE